jgi:Big-like domain-containing protein
VGVIAADFSLPTGELACSVPDQRGETRPSPCDIGAVNATGGSGPTSPPPSGTPTTVVVTDHALTYGEDSTFTATVSAGAGTVQFSVDNHLLGSPVQVSGGTATSPALSTLAGFPLAVGAHSVTAVYTPADPTMLSSADVKPLVVSKSATTTTVGVKPHALAALVSPTAPGSGTPTGSVTFSVGGKVVGTAALQHGGASVAYTMPAGSAAAVSATYAGDDNFTASSGSTARKNPAITATESSAHHKTRYGWYRSRVTVTFHCTRGSAPLASCPPPVTRHHNGKGQSVSRTIHDLDGGTASVTVDLNIDKKKPKVHVTGVRPGSTHHEVVTLDCVAHDSLSGVANCTVHDHRAGSVVHFTVRALDKAGNRRTRHGHYTIS